MLSVNAVNAISMSIYIYAAVSKIYRIPSTHTTSECVCFWSQILQTIRARLPHPPLMNPIGEGEGAAWASWNICLLWWEVKALFLLVAWGAKYDFYPHVNLLLYSLSY
jgi:hypothetical protein